MNENVKELRENVKDQLDIVISINAGDPIGELMTEFDCEEMMNKQNKEEWSDLEIFLDRSLDNCEISYQVLLDIVNVLRTELISLYESEFGKDFIDMSRINKLLKKEVNRKLDEIELKNDYAITMNDAFTDNVVQEAVAKPSSEQEGIWVDVAKLPIFLGDTIEERINMFLELKKKHGILLYDTSNDVNNTHILELEKELKEKDEYIKKLSLSLEKYSLLALHLKSISHEFRTNKLTELKFINRILKLSDQYK